MFQGRCPGVEVLHRFVRGDLDESAMMTVANHLEQCEACQQGVESEFQEGIVAKAMKTVSDKHSSHKREADKPPARLGHFRILKLLGQGAMGQVYLAEDSLLGRFVALKVIRARDASYEESQRFQIEANAAAKLNHPGIVPIYEVGEDAGRRYLTMALVEGETLAKRLASGPMPSREAARFLQQVAEAVEHAHSQGIIHRDLKPGNILLDQRGQPLVTDFGLAKQSATNSQLTQSGQVLGTPTHRRPTPWLTSSRIARRWPPRHSSASWHPVFGSPARSLADANGAKPP